MKVGFAPCACVVSYKDAVGCASVGSCVGVDFRAVSPIPNVEMTCFSSAVCAPAGPVES